MKSSALAAIFLFVLFYETAGMSVKGGMYRDPRNPNMCTIDNKMILRAGQVLKNPNGECAILTCFENGHVTMMGCVKQGMRPGCVEGNVLYPNSLTSKCTNN